MSDIKLFKYSNGSAKELEGKSALIERHIQNLIESQMEAFLGIRFLASEYTTGKNHKGRIDSLGFDENSCPVIIEYKRHINENVITQGLYYLDWLLDHQAEFKFLVLEKLGKDAAEKIEWQGTRLLCIAGDFSKFDEHAVSQIHRNVELIRYKLFGADLLLLELVNAVTSQVMTATIGDVNKSASTKSDKTFVEQTEVATPELKALYEEVASYMHSLGDDVQEKQLKLYTAFRRLKNFACAILLPKNDPKILLTLRLEPLSVETQEGFIRDVSNIGHWGTGDIEVTIRDKVSLEKAKSLIERSYQEN